MLQGLKKYEKSPDKGFIKYPKFGPEELSDVEEDEEEEDEVMLLEDISDKTSKQGGSKQCMSNQVKEPHEYVSKGFKIPKKSSQNDFTSSNDSEEKGTPFYSKYNDKTCWGLESSFHEDTSTMKTKLTRNSNPKYKPVFRKNIRHMMKRQDVTLSELLDKAKGSRNTSSLGLRKEASTSKKNTRKNEEPFNDEINQVMNRNKRTIDHKERNLSNSPNNRDCKVVLVKMKNSNDSDQENESHGQTTNVHDQEHDDDDDDDDDDDNGFQYFEKSYQKNVFELCVSSKSEHDCQQDPTSESNVCSDDGEENATPKKDLRQRNLINNFPSSAATPRHSIHEHSTSEDEKDNKSNTTSFYGSESKPRVTKTYGGRKSRTVTNDSGWISHDEEISVSTSDVEESPGKNKKRKIINRKNVRKNEKNENSKWEKQRKKHKTEPECLLISSSDEEDNHSGPVDGNVSGTESSMPETKSSKPTAENNYAMAANGQATGVCETTGAVDNPFERDSFTTEIMLGSKVMLGKLKGSSDGALEITAHQLKWRMKYMDIDDKPMEKVVLILSSDLTSFKIHDKDPKIIVLQVSQRCALKLRGKFSGHGKFFDPSSPVVEETEIVLEVDDVLTQETLADITEWVKDRLCKTFAELSHDEAEKLSERLSLSTDSSSKSGEDKQKSHYNTRSSATKSKARTSAVTPTKMIIYPFPPTPGGITVTSADVECLAEGEFLNDVIIDFYLKYIYHDQLSEDDKNRTHIFSSFFYKRLTQKNSLSNEFFESPHDRMHNQVKKWTRNVDIFSKDFIIVPINESSHWYLAIICFPNLDEPIEEESSSQEQSEESVIEDSEDAEEKENVKVNVDDDDEDDTDLETSALAVGAKKGTPSKKPAKKKKPVLKANPCILIFDSLANTGRAKVFTNLRNYLSREWRAKRQDKPAREFTYQSFRGTFPKVPEQDNHCDCGIFVLQYVESFFEDPIQDYRLPIHKTNWFTHNGISGKRQEIKNLILRLKEKYTSTSS